MEKFNFIGLGGATNIELGGNCCFYKNKNDLLIIDVCESATKKLKDLGAFKDIKNIYVIITHTHYDHIGGLGVFIWYCRYNLNIKPIIIYRTRKYSNHIKKILKLTGVKRKYVKFMEDFKFISSDLKIRLVPTSHVSYLQCFGVMFSDEYGEYYYSGDTNDINYIKKLTLDSEVKKIYMDISSGSSTKHIRYEDIKNLDKNKLVLMHFETNELYKKVIADGFNVPNINIK